MLFIIIYLNNECIEIIKGRRSIREFKNQEIKLEIIKDIIDAGRFAPSPQNRQPWEFIVIKKRSSCDTIFEHLVWLKEPNKEKRPVAYIIVITDKKNLGDISMVASIGACIQNILIASWSYGIGSCWVGSIKNKRKIERFLGIPEDLKIFAVIALGYPDNIPETIDLDTIYTPFLKENKLFVPKKTLKKILHIEKY